MTTTAFMDLVYLQMLVYSAVYKSKSIFPTMWM